MTADGSLIPPATPSEPPTAPPPGSLWSWSGWGWILPLLVGIGTWIGYLPHVCPVLFYGDSGEFLTAAATGGIAHPPGYPFYISLLGLWLELGWSSPSTWQAPLFGPAYSGNLFSLCCAALTLAVFCRLLWDSSRHAGWAVLGSILLAVTPTLFGQSLIAEVYTLQALLVVLLFWGYFRLLTTPTVWALWGICLVQGLLLAHHPSSVLWIPLTLLVLGVAASQGRRWFRPVWWTIAIFCFLLGLAPYLQLPIRSLQNPWLDWGNPEDWSRFWAVVTRAEYRDIKESLSGTPVGVMGIARAWAEWTFAQFGWLVVPLAVGAGLTIVRGGRWFVVLALGVGLAIVPYWIYFSTIPAVELPFLEVYFIPAHLLLLLWGLSGLMPLREGETEGPRIHLAGWQAAVLAVLVLGLAGRTWQASVAAGSRADSQIGSRFAVSTLWSIPERSILICEGDEIFLYWYCQAAAQLKPEVVIAEIDILRNTNTWYWGDLRRRHPDLVIPQTPSARELESKGVTDPNMTRAFMVRQLARANPDRRVFLTGLTANPANQTDYGVGWYGLLYELTPGRHLTLDPEAFYQQQLEPPGDLAWLTGQPSFDFYETQLREKYVRTLGDYGTRALAGGELAIAERLLHFTVQLDPTRWDVYRELGKTLLIREEWAEALLVFERLALNDAAEPLYPFAMAVAHYHLGDVSAARLAAAQAQALDPENRLLVGNTELLTQLQARSILEELLNTPELAPDTPDEE